MNKIATLVGAGALALGAVVSTPSYSQPVPGSISPHHTTGQQVGDQVPGGGLECDEGGSAPSQSGRDPGPGSPFQEDSISGSHYAGETDHNNKNTSSVSQYDLACFKGPNTN